jgi:hypothetical protein
MVCQQRAELVDSVWSLPFSCAHPCSVMRFSLYDNWCSFFYILHCSCSFCVNCVLVCVSQQSSAKPGSLLKVHSFRPISPPLFCIHLTCCGPSPPQPQVLDMLMSGVPRTVDGRVDYLAFVNAVRFNGLPVQQYSCKLRHRAAGDPDSPCGPSSIRWVGAAALGVGRAGAAGDEERWWD